MGGAVRAAATSSTRLRRSCAPRAASLETLSSWARTRSSSPPTSSRRRRARSRWRSAVSARSSRAAARSSASRRLRRSWAKLLTRVGGLDPKRFQRRLQTHRRRLGSGHPPAQRPVGAVGVGPPLRPRWRSRTSCASSSSHAEGRWRNSQEARGSPSSSPARATRLRNVSSSSSALRIAGRADAGNLAKRTSARMDRGTCTGGRSWADTRATTTASSSAGANNPLQLAYVDPDEGRRRLGAHPSDPVG